MQGVDRGLAAAAKDRGLNYRVLVADSDAARQAEHVRSLVAAKAGAVVASAVDSASLGRRLQEVIWSGGYVSTVVAPPATSLLNAPQYLTGKVLGDAASAHIKGTLGGKAKVVLLTQDSLEFLAPRFVAMRDSLRDLPGASIVADISPNPVSKDGGFATMRTILLANPDVDVVLGADNVVLGALAALRAAGKTRPDQFLGGIDGEPEAVAEIKKGNTPYKHQRQPRLAGFRLRDGPACRRLARGQEHPAGDGYPAHRADGGQHRAVRGRSGRSRSRLGRSGAARGVPQDVRQHLLRQPRPVCELSVVVGAEVAGPPVIERMRSDEAIHRSARAKRWIASLRSQ